MLQLRGPQTGCAVKGEFSTTYWDCKEVLSGEHVDKKCKQQEQDQKNELM